MKHRDAEAQSFYFFRENKVHGEKKTDSVSFVISSIFIPL